MNDEYRNIDEMTFREAASELDGIVRKLESNTMELEDTLAAYERGVHLISSLQKRLVEAEQKVDVLMGEITSFLLCGQSRHRWFIFRKEELFVQPFEQPVAVLPCGVAQQYKHICSVTVVSDGVLALLCLVSELCKDRRYGISLEMRRYVAQQNHAAAVWERCHPHALIMEAVLLAKVIVYRVRHPRRLATVYIHILTGDILIIKQPRTLPLHTLPYPRPRQTDYSNGCNHCNLSYPKNCYLAFSSHLLHFLQFCRS